SCGGGRQARAVWIENFRGPLWQPADVGAAAGEYLARLDVLEQREQQVLERQVLVMHSLGLGKREAKAGLQFFRYKGARHVNCPQVPSKALTETRWPSQAPPRS